MSTNLPDVKRRLVDLTLEEKADLAQDLFIENAKGQSRRSLARQYNVTEYAVRMLIEEYGAYMSKTRTHSKEAGIALYDYLIQKSIEILENPEGVPAIVRAKAFETPVQAQTRKDKLLGHEAPNINVNAGGETLRDMITQMYGGEDESKEVSAADGALIGQYEEDEETVLEGEIVDN